MKRLRAVPAILLCMALLAALQVEVFASMSSGTDIGLITRSVRDETGDELLLIPMNDQGDYKKFQKEMTAAATPNTVQSIKTISANGISTIYVKADFFGVVLEPNDKQAFTVDLVGTKDPGQVEVTAKAENGTLSVEVLGDHQGGRLLSTVANNRINVVRIGVPAGSFQTIQVQEEKNSCILVNELDIPVQADMKNGTIRVQGETLSQSVTMEGANGDLLIFGNRVEGPVQLKVRNGDVLLKAMTVTGKTQLNASNGDIKVDVESIKDAEFTATNGDIDAKIGTVVQRVSATVSSGDIVFHLIKQPTNLTLNFDGNENSEDVSLPKGWHDGYTVGNGQPVLQLGVGSGSLDLQVA